MRVAAAILIGLLRPVTEGAAVAVRSHNGGGGDRDRDRGGNQRKTGPEKSSRH